MHASLLSAPSTWLRPQTPPAESLSPSVYSSAANLVNRRGCEATSYYQAHPTTPCGCHPMGVRGQATTASRLACSCWVAPTTVQQASPCGAGGHRGPSALFGRDSPGDSGAVVNRLDRAGEVDLGLRACICPRRELLTCGSPSPGVGRAARGAAAPTAGRGGAARAGRASPPDAGAPVGSYRASAARGRADPDRTRRFEADEASELLGGGWERSGAWVPDFSSTHSTTAFSGGSW